MSTEVNFAPVSVVFPALNEERNVGGALEALLDQELPPAQVVLVDHNSTDRTGEIARSYAGRFLQRGIDFCIVSEHKPGIGNARSAGCQHATQPIIASMDADCRPAPQWLKVIAAAFAREAALDGLAGKIVYYDASWLVRKATEIGYFAVFYSVMRALCGFHTMVTSNAAFRASAYQKAGGFDVSIKSINGLDDADLASRVFNGRNIRYERDMVVYSSFRRFKNLVSAFHDNLERGSALVKIVQKYRRRRALVCEVI